MTGGSGLLGVARIIFLAMLSPLRLFLFGLNGARVGQCEPCGKTEEKSSDPCSFCLPVRSFPPLSRTRINSPCLQLPLRGSCRVAAIGQFEFSSEQTLLDECRIVPNCSDMTVVSLLDAEFPLPFDMLLHCLLQAEPTMVCPTSFGSVG